MNPIKKALFVLSSLLFLTQPIYSASKEDVAKVVTKLKAEGDTTTFIYNGDTAISYSADIKKGKTYSEGIRYNKYRNKKEELDVRISTLHFNFDLDKGNLSLEIIIDEGNELDGIIDKIRMPKIILSEMNDLADRAYILGDIKDHVRNQPVTIEAQTKFDGLIAKYLKEKHQKKRK